MGFDTLTIIFSVIAMLVSSGVHEFAHAYSAYLLGDDTARAEGRMTINPLAHIDPIGFLMMIVARIGWSKPVPVNHYNFDNPKVGSAIVAVAGPLSNLLLAFLSGFILLILTIVPIPGAIAGILASFMVVMLFVNVSLMLFNLLPISPLDGSHIIELLIPASLQEFWDGVTKYSPYLILLFFLPISPLFTLFNEIWYNLLSGTVSLILSVFGLGGII